MNSALKSDLSNMDTKDRDELHRIEENSRYKTVRLET